MINTRAVIAWIGISAVAALSVAAAAPRPPLVPLKPAAAASPTAESVREADREAIRQASVEFIKAFEQGNAKAVAATWTEQGEYYDDQGAALRGRAAIEAAYAQFFAEKQQATLEIDIRAIRFPSRDTAIEDGVLRVTHAGPELPTSTRYSTLHVREDGQWKVVVSREWGAGQDKLEDLAWLIGNWVAGAKDREVHMQFEWNEPKTLIHQRFAVREGGLIVSSGMHTISVDPQTGRLRSTTVDDDGGRGESVWNRDGNRWVLDSTGTLSDGRETSSIDLLTRLNPDEFVWRSTSRTIEGQEAPDTQPMKVSRVKVSK